MVVWLEEQLDDELAIEIASSADRACVLLPSYCLSRRWCQGLWELKIEGGALLLR
jgi:hypothetical protein